MEYLRLPPWVRVAAAPTVFRAWKVFNVCEGSWDEAQVRIIGQSFSWPRMTLSSEIPCSCLGYDLPPNQPEICPDFSCTCCAVTEDSDCQRTSFSLHALEYSPKR